MTEQTDALFLPFLNIVNSLKFKRLKFKINLI